MTHQWPLVVGCFLLAGLHMACNDGAAGGSDAVERPNDYGTEPDAHDGMAMAVDVHLAGDARAADAAVFELDARMGAGGDDGMPVDGALPADAVSADALPPGDAAGDLEPGDGPLDGGHGPRDGGPDPRPGQPFCSWSTTPAYDPYEGHALRLAAHCAGTRWQEPPPLDEIDRITLIGDSVLTHAGFDEAAIDDRIWRSFRRRLVDLLAPRLLAEGPALDEAAGELWVRGTGDGLGGAFRACSPSELHRPVQPMDLVEQLPLLFDGWLNGCTDGVGGQDVIVVITLAHFAAELPPAELAAYAEDAEDGGRAARFAEAVADVRRAVKGRGARRVWVYVTDFIDYSDQLDHVPAGCDQPVFVPPADPPWAGGQAGDAVARDALATYRQAIGNLNRELARAAVAAADDPDTRFDLVFANGRMQEGRGLADCRPAEEHDDICDKEPARGDPELALCCRASVPRCFVGNADANQVLARAVTQTILDVMNLPEQ